MSRKSFRQGDHVEWQTSQGKTSGKVEKKLTSPRQIKGHQVKASPANPEYLVKSDESGEEASHKPEALAKKANRR